jgi:hypothetical protein
LPSVWASTRQIFFRAYFDFLAPYSHSEQLVVLRPETLGLHGVMSEDFTRWREQTTVFQELGTSTERDLNIRTPDGSINVVASLVTPGFYRMMGDRFSLGYDFVPEDGAPGENRLVILTNSCGSGSAPIPLLSEQTFLWMEILTQ